MLDQLALALVVFLTLFRWIVFFDVILSWTAVFGFRINVPFVRALLDPCYAFMEKRFPVSFSGLNFAPIFLILAAIVVESVLRASFPSVTAYL